MSGRKHEAPAGQAKALHATTINNNEGGKSIAEYPDILTLQQACKLLQVGPTTCRTLCRRGTLKHFRVGVLYRFSKADLLALIEGGSQ